MNSKDRLNLIESNNSFDSNIKRIRINVNVIIGEKNEQNNNNRVKNICNSFCFVLYLNLFSQH
jgi:hypothetical protein